MQTLQVQVIVLLLAVSSACGSLNFDKIDVYLKQKLDHKASASANMEAAYDLLKEKLESSTTCIRNIFCRSSVRNLREFTDLREVDNPEERCTEAMFSILTDTDGAVRNRAHKTPEDFLKQQGISRVEQVIHHYHLRHAIRCAHVYPLKLAEKFGEGKSQLPEDVAESMDLIDRLAAKAWFYKTNGLKYNLDSKKLKKLVVLSPITAMEMLRLLRALKVEQDLDLAVVSSSSSSPVSMPRAGEKETVISLLKRYIFKPCHQYVELTKGIFLPADYDHSMGVDYLLEEDANDTRYHEWLARFRVCRGLAEGGATAMGSLIMDLMRGPPVKKHH